MREGYKLTELGEIPESWEVIKLGDIFKLSSGEGLSKNLSNEGDFPVYGGNGISFYHSKYTHENAQLIIGRVGAYCGCVHRTPPKSWITDNALFIKNKLKIYEDEFLFYVLNKLDLNTFANKNAQPVISGQKIYPIAIMFPTLPEQKKIAKILSTVDEKIEVIETQINQTQELKKGLMQQLLTKGIGHTKFKDSPLGEIPESWEIVKIDDLLHSKRILSHLDGNHGELYPKAHEFVEDGIPYVGANSFVNGKVNFSICKRLSQERANLFRKGVARNGDVLFAHNATVGPVAFLQTNLDFVILSTTATYFRLDNKTIDSKYWLYFLSSPYFSNQYIKVMGQSTRNQVPITMQRSFLSLLPSISEQKILSSILYTVDEKLEILETKKNTFIELKKGLMQQLLTGKIRTQ